MTRDEKNESAQRGARPSGDAPPQGGCRILIAGTGGQGAMLAARLLTGFFVAGGRQVLSGQLHGMAQRGGAVQATVIVDRGISPAIPLGGADFVVGLEPVETARALPYMAPATHVFMNSTPIMSYALAQDTVHQRGSGVYPERGRLERAIRAVTPHLTVLDATALARAAGSPKTVNVVMLGCLFGSGAFPFAAEAFVETVIRKAPPKLVETNVRAFRSGAAITAGAGEPGAAAPAAGGGGAPARVAARRKSIEEAS